jgi:hypothetical protein
MSLTFTIQDGNERLTNYAGLALIGALLETTSITERVSAIVLPSCVNPEISHGDIIASMTGLLSLGMPSFAAIEQFRGDPFFAQSLGLDACPSESILRQRLDGVETAFDAILKEESASLLRHRMPSLGLLTTSAGRFAPLDVDVSPFDNSGSQKEGVSKTYKGYDGYAPIFAYLGREGYLVNAELREGKQHCQLGTPAFLRETFRYAKQITDKKLLLRLDAGNDSQDNLVECVTAGVDWIIKRNLRKESLTDWLALAQKTGTASHPRPGKTIWRGETFREVPGFAEPLRIVFEVTERTSALTGQLFLVPTIAVDTYWTSLACPPEELIELYHDHGTSEQYHSEIKTDMHLERLPSTWFATNALILLLGMVAYNLLRLCGQESLREPEGETEPRPAYRRPATRRRVRIVIQDLMTVACRLITRARAWRISFGRYFPWKAVWTRLYRTFTTPVKTEILVTQSP